MSSDIEPTRELEQITVKSDTRDVLAHAAKEVERKGFDKFLIVDIDAHVTETAFWSEIVDRIEQLANVAINLHQHVAPRPFTGFSDEIGMGHGWEMCCRVREVDEERFLCFGLSFHESNCPVRQVTID